MESFSALLALCVGRSPVTGRFPLQRPVTRGLDIFFDLCQNKLSNKQPRRWWFETPSRPLWRHCDEALVYVCKSIYIYMCVHMCDDILFCIHPCTCHDAYAPKVAYFVSKWCRHDVDLISSLLAIWEGKYTLHKMPVMQGCDVPFCRPKLIIEQTI